MTLADQPIVEDQIRCPMVPRPSVSKARSLTQILNSLQDLRHTIAMRSSILTMSHKTSDWSWCRGHSYFWQLFGLGPIKCLSPLIDTLVVCNVVSISHNRKQTKMEWQTTDDTGKPHRAASGPVGAITPPHSSHLELKIVRTWHSSWMTHALITLTMCKLQERLCDELNLHTVL
jgi:hypothetical protein